MNEDPNFCRARALAEHEAATRATLTNVRDRALRAAARWEQMAERGEKHQRLQAARIAGARS
jgi:hypothetical protein